MENTPSDNYLIDKANWPPALIKAMHDPFYYQVKLLTGEEWYIESAQYLNDHYACLKILREWRGANIPQFDRGVEVRVSNIAWIADAPKGASHVTV